MGKAGEWSTAKIFLSAQWPQLFVQIRSGVISKIITKSDL